MRTLVLTLLLARSVLAQFADVTSIGPTTGCQPVTRPFSDQLHWGGLICNPTPPIVDGIPFGGTLVDPSFGGTSTALTAPSRTLVHGYSLPSALSANNRYANVSDVNGNHFVVEVKTGAITPISAPNNAILWNPQDDDCYWTVEPHAVVKHSIEWEASKVVADYTGHFTQLQNGGSAHVSSDGWLSFWDEGTHSICALNTNSRVTYCDHYNQGPAAAVSWDFIDYTMVTRVDSGSTKRYVLLMASPAMGVWSVNTRTGKLDFEYRGPELPKDLGYSSSTGNNDDKCDPGEHCLDAPHADVTSINGVQYLMFVTDTNSDPCERDLVAIPIAQGLKMIRRKTTILPLAYCSSQYQWPDHHISCSQVTGQCAISTMSTGQAPYGGQVLLIQDLGHVVRLAMHRSVPGATDGYWYSPRASISLDGSYVVYDSNLGRPDEGNGMSHEQVFMLKTKK